MSAADDRVAGTASVDHIIPGICALRGFAAMTMVLFLFTQLTSVAMPESVRFAASDFALGLRKVTS